ncbi:MAG TPA: hypothetical protein VFL69_03960 [Marmoricola sp.]|jgi:hypothetical protein|nr:hypothetical protein [Marmoricola sp.]
MSGPTSRPGDEAFPAYRSDAADRDRTRRRVRQVTALLGVGAAVGTGAFTVGLAFAGTPTTPTPTTTVASTPTGAAPAPPPTTLTRSFSDDGDDGGWHRAVAAGTAQTSQVPTTGGVGSATTSGGSTAVAVP